MGLPTAATVCLIACLTFGVSEPKADLWSEVLALADLVQGVGLVRGIGARVDREGDDVYIADDKILKYPAVQTKKHNTRLAQGVGYGFRRADLAGDIGLLIDGGGDDQYAAGLFLDEGGDNRFPADSPARPRSHWLQSDRPQAHGIGVAR